MNLCVIHMLGAILSELLDHSSRNNILLHAWQRRPKLVFKIQLEAQWDSVETS